MNVELASKRFVPVMDGEFANKRFVPVMDGEFADRKDWVSRGRIADTHEGLVQVWMLTWQEKRGGPVISVKLLKGDF